MPGVPYNSSPINGLSRKVKVFALLISSVFLVLTLRLWGLQILQGKRYYTLSQNNRLRLQIAEAPRGLILDRNGEVIVENRPSFDVLAIPEDVKNIEGTSSLLSKILGVPSEEIRSRLQGSQARPYQTVLLRKEIGLEPAITIEERKLDLPGISLQVRPVRSYPSGLMAAQLLGYVREINQAQLQQEEFQDFRPGDNLGQGGIEGKYDPLVRGIDGGDQIEVDARGRVIKVVERIEPMTGYALVLTIDKRLQSMAEEAFAGKKGTVVVMDPNNGEILAMVSRPSYDPSLFASRLTPEEWERVVEDPDHPLQNRSFQAQYPPGSIFKLVTALAALEKGAITPETKFTCNGSFSIGNYEYLCWKPEGHGTLDLYQAIAVSCNVYFYNVALRTGINDMARVARELGFGEETGIQLGSEARGLVPSPKWKLRFRGEPWFPGNTVQAAIGQGLVSVTPLQMINAISAIANGGTIYRPRVLKRVLGDNGEVIEEYGPEIIHRLSLRPENLAILRKAMEMVVNQGTGVRARIPGLEVAGKTATAQIVGKTGRERGPLRPDLRDHAWFVAFAPVNEPKIAVAVIVENGGFGGVVGAPIARALIEAALLPSKGISVAAAPGAKEPVEIGD